MMLQEAVNWAIVDLIQANIALINTELAIDANTPIVLASSNVHLGDFLTIPSSVTSPAWICVTPNDTQLTETWGTMTFTKASGRRVDVETMINVYINSDTLKNADPKLSEQNQTLALMRISEGLRYQIFAPTIQLGLQSQQFNTGTNYDTLNMCHITECTTGIMAKGPGEYQYVKMARLRHTGFAQS